MNAPDKIYINKFEANVSEDTKAIGVAFTEQLDTRFIEYIRKDALLEWAKRERVVGSDCKSCDGWAYAFSTVIEKLQIM